MMIFTGTLHVTTAGAGTPGTIRITHGVGIHGTILTTRGHGIHMAMVDITTVGTLLLSAYLAATT